MAAQARHYDKNSHYASRQDEKYISAKSHRHSLLHSSSHKSSPFKNQSNNSSPLSLSRKRSYASPKSYSQNSSFSSTFVLLKQKDHSGSHTFPEEDLVDNDDSDWTQHISSSGKVYFYNKKTEQSQWEMPSNWIMRDGKCVSKESKDDYRSSGSSSSRDSFRETSEPREGSFNEKTSTRAESKRQVRRRGESRDSSLSTKVLENEPADTLAQRDKQNKGNAIDSRFSRGSRDSRDLADSREYRNSGDFRGRLNSRDMRDLQDLRNARDSPTLRERHRKPKRGFWESENSYLIEPMDTREESSRSYERPASVSDSRKEVYLKRYNSEPVRTVGLPTCASSTSSSRNGVVDSTVQDISPPSTPTEIMDNSLTGLIVDSVSPLSLISTPQRSVTVHLNLASTPLLSATTSHPQTPVASPKQLATVASSSAPTLHPLQQALLLQQQQHQQQLPSGTPANGKSGFDSPRLTSAKSVLPSSGDNSSSPQNAMLSSLFLRGVAHSPSLPRPSSSSTPPPPPPPLGTPKVADKDRTKLERHRRDTGEIRDGSGAFLSMDSVVSNEKEETPSKVTGAGVRLADERIRSRARARVDPQANVNDALQKTERTLMYTENSFDELPDIERCKDFYSNTVIDFTAGYYGNILERQANSCWDETMASLASDGYRTKSQISLTQNEFWVLDTRLSVTHDWYSALNQVAVKLESLQDGKLTSENRSKTKEQSKSDSPVASKDFKPGAKGVSSTRTGEGDSHESASTGLSLTVTLSLDPAPSLGEKAT